MSIRCGEPCAARSAWAKIEKADTELGYFREELRANNFSAAEQHLENYKNYIAAAREIIQKAGSEYPELPESVRRNWSYIFQRADVRANEAAAVLEMVKVGAQIPVREIMTDLTTANTENLKVLTRAVRDYYAVQSENLEKFKALFDQYFGSVSEDQCLSLFPGNSLEIEKAALKEEIAYIEKIVIGLQSDLELLENELARRGINIE